MTWSGLNLSKGLGFSKEDRDTNILRIGWVAERLTYHGAAVLVSAISPYREARNEVPRRRFHGSSRCSSRHRSRSAPAVT